MKFKRHLKIDPGLTSLDIIPIINCFFLLIVFVLLTSTLTLQTGIHVKLPKTLTSSIIQNQNIITITSDDVIYFNNDVSTIKEITQELSKPKNKNGLILIQADRRASVGRIVDIWNLCRKLGIEKINIATDQEKQ